MFDKNVKITGVRPQDANALWRLLTFKDTQRTRPTVCLALLRDGAASVVTDGSRRYSLPEKLRKITAQNIEEVASAARAKFVIAVEEAELPRLVERIQGRFRGGADNFELMEAILRSLKEAVDAGCLILYPDIFNFVFELDARKMRRFFDVVFPRGTSMVFYFFRHQGVEAGLIVVRSGDLVDVIAGHEAISGDVSGFHPWRKGYVRLLETVGKKYAPPCLGFFAEIEEMEQVLWYPQPGAFLKGIIAGKVVIDPMPAWVAAALGVDAVTRVAQTSLDLIRHFDTLGIARRFDLGSIGRTIQQRLQKEDLTLEAILGFDPVTLLGKTISWLAR